MQVIWLCVLERLLVGGCMIVCNVFEVLIIETIQNWLVAIWRVDYLQIDHGYGFGRSYSGTKFAFVLEVLNNLSTGPSI